MSENLFIVGPARSGTSILLKVLNTTREIYLYSELHAPIIAAWPRFRQRADGVHWTDGFITEKRRQNQSNKGGDDGTLTGRTDLHSPIDAFDVPSGYRYVGEKVALFYAPRITQTVPDFYQSHFPSGFFLCALRKPSDVYFSAMEYRKSTPWGFNPERALLNLAAAIQATCDIAHASNHARILPMERVDQHQLGTIGAWLGVARLDRVWQKLARPSKRRSYDGRSDELTTEVRGGLNYLDEWYNMCLDDDAKFLPGPSFSWPYTT